MHDDSTRVCKHHTPIPYVRAESSKYRQDINAFVLVATIASDTCLIPGNAGKQNMCSESVSYFKHILSDCHIILCVNVGVDVEKEPK